VALHLLFELPRRDLEVRRVDRRIESEALRMAVAKSRGATRLVQVPFDEAQAWQGMYEGVVHGTFDQLRTGERLGAQVGKEFRLGEHVRAMCVVEAHAVRRIDRVELSLVLRNLVLRAQVVGMDDSVHDQHVVDHWWDLPGTARPSRCESGARFAALIW